jgi:Tfp pilus assembly protein PilV
MTLFEVLLAIAFIAIALLALLGLLSVGYLNVAAGGSQSKATTYARQEMEQLRNQPFNPGPANGSNIPEPGISRAWAINPVGGTPAPNRLARITVTVTVNQTAGMAGAPSVTFETMRSE